MKTIYKKLFIKLAGALCLLLTGYMARAQTTLNNFSGKWVLNEDRSDFGRLTAASASKLRTLTITQTKADVTIASGDSTGTARAVLNLNGKPSEMTVSTVVYDIPNTLTADLLLKVITPDSFTTTSEQDPLRMYSSSVKTYSLSAGSQTLVVDYQNNYGELNMAGKLVYDKQKN